MTATIAARGRLRAEEQRIDWAGYVFVAFFTVPFILFNIAPIFFGAYVGFTKWGIFGKPKWIGLQNFTDAFKDEFVAIAFKNTVLYGVIIVPCVVVIGFSFALSTNVTAASLAEAKKQGAVLAWGNFFTIVLNFLIVAWVMFFVARFMNRLKQLQASEPAAAPAPTRQEVLLTEIRDLLKNAPPARSAP